MKKSLLLILSLCTASIFYAQTSGIRTEFPAEMVRNFQMGNNKLPANVKGSPYIHETFLPGTVVIKSQSYNTILRYNAYADEIEMKNERNENIALLKRDYILASFGGEEYTIINLGEKKGYVLALEKGDISLFKRHTKEFVPEKKATSSYGNGKPAQLVDNISYYLVVGDKPAKQIKLRKNDLIKLIGEKKVKDYSKMSKSKLNSESEIINFIKNLNTTQS